GGRGRPGTGRRRRHRSGRGARGHRRSPAAAGHASARRRGRAARRRAPPRARDRPPSGPAASRPGPRRRRALARRPGRGAAAWRGPGPPWRGTTSAPPRTRSSARTRAGPLFGSLATLRAFGAPAVARQGEDPIQEVEVALGDAGPAIPRLHVGPPALAERLAEAFVGDEGVE